MYLSIGASADLLGISTSTLRLWEKTNQFIPAFRTKGGHRRYKLDQVMSLRGDVAPNKKQTLHLAYARVSSSDQKDDLARQKKSLQEYCQKDNIEYEIISDLGSGLNYKKRGLKKLIKMILSGTVKRIVLTHKDRLLRFGSEIIFHLCSFFRTEIVMIHEEESLSDEIQLARDVLEIITVFSSRLYGRRAHLKKRSQKQ
jgi:putative resolvase